MCALTDDTFAPAQPSTKFVPVVLALAHTLRIAQLVVSVSVGRPV